MSFNTLKVANGLMTIVAVWLVLCFGYAAYLDSKLLRSPSVPNHATGEIVQAQVKGKLVYTDATTATHDGLISWVLCGVMGLLALILVWRNRLDPNAWFGNFYKGEMRKLERKHWDKLDREP